MRNTSPPTFWSRPWSFKLDDRLRAEGFLPEAFTLGCSKPVSTSSTPPGQVFVRRKLSDRELVEPVEGEMRGGPI